MKLTRKQAAQSILAQCPPERRSQLIERMPWLAVANKPQRAPRTKRNKQPEQALQIACVKLLRSLPGTMVWSCPNHLYIGKMTGAKMGYVVKQKAMGLLGGVADLIVLFRSVDGVLSVVLPELKVLGNNLSDSQVSFANQAASLGCVPCVIHSVDELVAVLRRWGHPSFQS